MPGTGMLTADLATSACGVEFLRELPPERGRRLAGMMARLGVRPAPPPSQLAAWTETMLGVMLSSRNPISDWDVAYLTLPGCSASRRRRYGRAASS